MKPTDLAEYCGAVILEKEETHVLVFFDEVSFAKEIKIAPRVVLRQKQLFPPRF